MGHSVSGEKIYPPELIGVSPFSSCGRLFELYLMSERVSELLDPCSGENSNQKQLFNQESSLSNTFLQFLSGSEIDRLVKSGGHFNKQEHGSEVW